jgi:hypothetical protein
MGGLVTRRVPLWIPLLLSIAAVAWIVGTRHTASPRVIDGWAVATADGSVIKFFESVDASEGEGYVIARIAWRSADGDRHGRGVPSCLEPVGSAKAHVRLGIIDVVDRVFGSHTQVVWLECPQSR